jgi:hypothetical protein
MTLREHPFPKEGDFIALMTKNGRKPSNIRVIRSIDKLFPQLTLEECEQLDHWLTRYMLMEHDLDPEMRRKLLSKFDSCPCCQSWLGHNRPPAHEGDLPPRRQKSFDFDR